MHKYVRDFFNHPIQKFDKIIPLTHQSKVYLSQKDYIMQGSYV